MTGPAPAGFVLNHLDLPESLRGHRRGRGGPGGQPQEHGLLLPILVHREKFFLLGVEQPDHVPALEDVFLILLVLEEKVYLPACLRVDNIDLKVSRIKMASKTESHSPLCSPACQVAHGWLPHATPGMVQS